MRHVCEAAGQTALGIAWRSYWNFHVTSEKSQSKWTQKQRWSKQRQMRQNSVKRSARANLANAKEANATLTKSEQSKQCQNSRKQVGKSKMVNVIKKTSDGGHDKSRTGRCRTGSGEKTRQTPLCKARQVTPTASESYADVWRRVGWRQHT